MRLLMMSKVLKRILHVKLKEYLFRKVKKYNYLPTFGTS